MRIKTLVLSLLLALLTHSATAWAAEPIPRAEFIRMTEEILNSLDRVEAVFRDSDAKVMEAKLALREFDISTKKYDRYVRGRWPEGKQAEIAWAFAKAWMAYDLTLSEGTYGKSHKDAEASTQEVRDLFAKYRRQKK